MTRPNAPRSGADGECVARASDRAHNLSEPWEAEALALVIALQEAGHVSVEEWSSALGNGVEKIEAADEADATSSSSRHVLATLESLVFKKGLVARAELRERRQQWEQAYRMTPHGQPVRLRVSDGPS